MGEVYQATDTNLRRAVAIKVLPQSVSSDPDRLARFHREAQILAALNHPHIAQIHGLEQTDGLTALVMELVEGPTLADRIALGAMPVVDALRIAREIAEALETAHDRGIIHRDLKPANIKLRLDGTVKVLDFGLAKELEPAAIGSMPGHSPTITAPAMTLIGAVLGTAAYMSPEQARGEPLDRRSDIWAFGCVVYEMLTGRRVFAGETVTDTIAAVLEHEPDWGALSSSARPVGGILRRCLEKDRLRRLRDIADVRLWLEDIAQPPSATSPPAASAARRGWIAAAATMGVLIGGAAVGLLLQFGNGTAARAVGRFELTAVQTDSFTAETFGNNVAISPDGSRIVYTASRNGVPQLFMHRLDSLDATPVEGTEGATYPFFSPDGKQIGYATIGAVKSVSTDGGPSVTICETDAGFRGATWGPDGAIVIAQHGALELIHVLAPGGAPQQFAAPDAARGEEAYIQPAMVPGSDIVLYTVQLNGGHTRVAARRVGGRDAASVAPDGFGPQYLPPGYIIFGQGDRLLAVRFDRTTLQVSGSPIAVQENAFTKITDGIANVAIAADGTTVYAAGHNAGSLRRPVWVDRHGVHVAPVIGQPLEYARNPRLSPDGQRLALTVGTSGHADIWVYNLDRPGQPLKLTFQNHNTFPVWSTDGKWISFLSVTTSAGRMFRVPSDGSTLQPERLTTDDSPEIPLASSPDGESLLFRKDDDLWVMSLRDRKMRPWVQTPFSEHAGGFSPNGRWVTYSSTQTGQMEVWVRPFPGPGAPIRVSSDGGHDPVWARDGKELFYENTGKLLAARVVSEAPELRLEPPQVLFEGGFAHDDTDPGLRFFDAAADGRLLMIEPIGTSKAASLVVVQHWDQEMARAGLAR